MGGWNEERQGKAETISSPILTPLTPRPSKPGMGGVHRASPELQPPPDSGPTTVRDE